MALPMPFVLRECTKKTLPLKSQILLKHKQEFLFIVENVQSHENGRSRAL